MKNNGTLLLALYKELGLKGLFVNFLPLLGMLAILLIAAIWAIRPSNWGLIVAILMAVFISLFTPSYRKKYLRKRGIGTEEN